MGQYIDKDKIRYRKVPIDTTQELVYRSDIEAMDGEDVAPVRHGHWLVNFRYGLCKCYECGVEIEENVEIVQNCWKYCPHCGAKMDGKE